MDFTKNTNGSLALKKFTNNRYHAKLFEQPENPTAIDELTRYLLTPELSIDELLGLIIPYGRVSFTDSDGKECKSYTYYSVSSAGPVVYDNELVDGVYTIYGHVGGDLKDVYDAGNSAKYFLYIARSGRVLTLNPKNTPWQTIVDYLDSLNGGE